MNLRTVLLATALIVSPLAAFADLAISGQDGKQVRAGDGLPMKPTPDSVATISFCNATLLRVVGLIFPAHSPFETSSSGMLSAVLPQE